MPRQGSLLRISSALNSELNAPARAVVAVAFGPDRGDSLGVGETVGVSNCSILNSAVAVKPNSALFRQRIAVSEPEVPSRTRPPRHRRINGQGRLVRRQRSDGIVLQPAEKERPQPPLLDHPGPAALGESDLDRTHLSSPTQTVPPRPFDSDRIRGDHEHSSRTGCVTRNCHLLVQQTHRLPPTGALLGRSTLSWPCTIPAPGIDSRRGLLRPFRPEGYDAICSLVFRLRDIIAGPHWPQGSSPLARISMYFDCHKNVFHSLQKN